MRQALGAMYDVKSGLFPTAISQNHRFQGVSSESLHMLAYLDPEDLPPHKPGIPEMIERTSKPLKTSIGYKTFQGTGSYPSENVWPFEQAMINMGAKRHGLREASEISQRCKKALDESFTQGMVPEYYVQTTDWTEAGCSIQLLSVGAWAYFGGEGEDSACSNTSKAFRCQVKGLTERTFPCSRMNDDFCDCTGDGFDEPNTSACSAVRKGKSSIFTCLNGEQTFVSRIGDGIRDCSDGSDEL
mmetsp:Transcript_34606/g.55778  ORF Transcript_34606/g.55778 Transcript_34606/m.55778 type:complete len:243 (-) Transcript_34606:174-902(-)